MNKKYTFGMAITSEERGSIRGELLCSKWNFEEK